MMTESSNSPLELSQSQGETLVALARHTLMERLGCPIPEDQSRQLTNRLQDPDLHAVSGTFVTLKIGEDLRGCIGSLTGREPLADGVRANAINAAFQDPRFDPMTVKEIDKVGIEVSVLTQPRPLNYTDADNLVTKLRPHIDGVTLRKGAASATFLPQVWGQLPNTEAFLSHLCSKAGLDANEWRHGELEVETYQVQCFEESR